MSRLFVFSLDFLHSELQPLWATQTNETENSKTCIFTQLKLVAIWRLSWNFVSASHRLIFRFPFHSHSREPIKKTSECTRISFSNYRAAVGFGEAQGGTWVNDDVENSTSRCSKLRRFTTPNVENSWGLLHAFVINFDNLQHTNQPNDQPSWKISQSITHLPTSYVTKIYRVVLKKSFLYFIHVNNVQTASSIIHL